MSIEPHPNGKSLTPNGPPSWGEMTAVGETAAVVRFIIENRAITIPASRFRRWEHTRGVPETLTIDTDQERVTAVGRNLEEVTAALDLGRLCELRANFPRTSGGRPGPRIERLTIEPA